MYCRGTSPAHCGSSYIRGVPIGTALISVTFASHFCRAAHREPSQYCAPQCTDECAMLWEGPTGMGSEDRPEEALRAETVRAPARTMSTFPADSELVGGPVPDAALR